ncbi:RepB family protein [Holdemanella biformis]|uniref:RepB family protein n=1 Tax=Holdemanella biformis TaxID=1735 RepID=UPI002E77B7E0|nr:RepB family protein [Holdemanella biformis]
MSKPKKDWKALNIKIQSKVYNELEKYCEETGLSKTVAVERILLKAFEKYEQTK